MSKIKDIIFDRTHTDAIKGIAILLVMLGHVGVIPYAGAYGVVLFLMLSGFGLIQSYFTSGLEFFFSKRLSKVLIPYSMITIIWILIFGYPDISNSGYYQLILTILGVDFNSKVDPTMWFITYLIIWYLSFYLIFSARTSNYVKILFLFLFSIFLYKNANIFPQATGAGLYVMAFPIGATMGMVYYKIKEYSICRKYLILFFSVISIASLCAAIYFYKGIEVSFYYYAATNVSSAFLIIGLTSLFRIFSVNTGVFEFFGKLSYDMYLLEGMFLIKFSNVLLIFSSKSLNAMIFILIVTVFALIFKTIRGALE